MDAKAVTASKKHNSTRPSFGLRNHHETPTSQIAKITTHDASLLRVDLVNKNSSIQERDVSEECYGKPCLPHTPVQCHDMRHTISGPFISSAAHAQRQPLHSHGSHDLSAALAKTGCMIRGKFVRKGVKKLSSEVIFTHSFSSP